LILETENRKLSTKNWFSVTILTLKSDKPAISVEFQTGTASPFIERQQSAANRFWGIAATTA